MEIIRVKIKKLHQRAILPTYAHGYESEAGMDLYALDPVVLLPCVPTLVTTGIAIELPPGFEGQVRGRSGLAAKFGIHVTQGTGTIDPGYRGELKGLLTWDGHAPEDSDIYEYRINAGDRIAQLIVARYAGVIWDETGDLNETSRGTDGFGSTGLQGLRT